MTKTTFGRLEIGDHFQVRSECYRKTAAAMAQNLRDHVGTIFQSQEPVEWIQKPTAMAAQGARRPRGER